MSPSPFSDSNLRLMPCHTNFLSDSLFQMDQLPVPIRGTWLSTVVLACTALLLLRVVGTAIYNIFFHPLSSYPGPILCKVSRIPFWAACLRGNQVFFMKKLHDKYGTVIRSSPDELSYTDGQAWKDICAYQKGRPENLKTPSFQYVHSSSIFLIFTTAFTTGSQQAVSLALACLLTWTQDLRWLAGKGRLKVRASPLRPPQPTPRYFRR